MVETVYKVITLIGTSSESWEKAAAAAVQTASKSLRDLRIAEVVELDMQIEDGKVLQYRAKVRISWQNGSLSGGATAGQGQMSGGSVHGRF